MISFLKNLIIEYEKIEMSRSKMIYYMETNNIYDSELNHPVSIEAVEEMEIDMANLYLAVKELSKEL